MLFNMSMTNNYAYSRKGGGGDITEIIKEGANYKLAIAIDYYLYSLWL